MPKIRISSTSIQGGTRVENSENSLSSAPDGMHNGNSAAATSVAEQVNTTAVRADGAGTTRGEPTAPVGNQTMADNPIAGTTTVTGTLDEEYENYKNIVERFMKSGEYMTCDYVKKGLYRWARTSKAQGYGEGLLDRRRNADAIFTLIGQVLPDAMELGPVPEWDDKNSDKFRGARYRLSVGPLTSSASLQKDFDEGVTFLRTIMAKKSAVDAKAAGTIFHFETDSVQDVFGLKFSRRFFSKRQSNGEQSTHNVGNDNTYPWGFQNARDHYVNNLQDSWVPTPFPALDKTGVPIPPPSVVSALTNANVAVSFKLHHYKIDGRFIYNADLVSVIVLD